MDSRPDTWAHIHEVRERLTAVVKVLADRAQRHDQSKLHPPEVEVFDEYTELLAHTPYGTPDYKAALKGMGRALQHHYQVNDHHPEHHPNGVHDMNLLQMIEMLADWKAATLRHLDGDLERSIGQNAERFGYGDEIKRLLCNTARDMGWLT